MNYCLLVTFLVLGWDWDTDVLGNAFTVVWMDLNVEHPEQESASSFILFSLKKVKVIYFFSYLYSHKTHRMGEG